jgi:hypothetical protein
LISNGVRGRGRGRGRPRSRAFSQAVSSRSSVQTENDSNIDTAKDGTEWYKMQLGEKTRIRNVIKFSSVTGPSFYARQQIGRSFLTAFELIIDEYIIESIAHFTNEFASEHLWIELNLNRTELLAFIAILFARGVFCPNTPLNELWSKKYGIPVIKDLMSRDRFRLIKTCLRFDSKTNRPLNSSTDRFKLIRPVWERFVENCVCAYKPGKHLTKHYENRETGAMLTVYQCKPAKNVVILSTEDCEAYVPTSIELKSKYTLKGTESVKLNVKQKPLSVLSYNAHKAGVDSVDQMTRAYNVKAPTRRWPVQVFFNMLNLTSINAWVLYKETNKIKISRRNLIIGLIEEISDLVKPSSKLLAVPPSPLASRLAVIPLSSPVTPKSAKRTISSPVQSTKKKICVEKNASNEIDLCVPTNSAKYCKAKIKCSGRNRAVYVCTSCTLQVCGTCCTEVLQIATCSNCSNA